LLCVIGLSKRLVEDEADDVELLEPISFFYYASSQTKELKRGETVGLETDTLRLIILVRVPTKGKKEVRSDFDEGGEWFTTADGCKVSISTTCKVADNHTHRFETVIM